MSCLDAYFSLRSAGLGVDDSLEGVRASAKGAAIQLGNTQDIALLAGGALNVYGREAISATRAVEIMLATVKAGNIKDAAALAREMPDLLSVASELGVTFEELGAAVAGYTRTGLSVPQVTTAIRAALNKMFAPTEEGAKVLEKIGLTSDDLRTMVKSQGLLKTIQRFYLAVEGSPDEVRRFFQEVTAVGAVAHASRTMEQYDEIIGQIFRQPGKPERSHGHPWTNRVRGHRGILQQHEDYP